uniref:Chromosome passenger complex (CPC) protein INCENP N-terminal domain-containing protein n=1 Tax=Neogobius melanostomus TaxID=47308 RepID=A0A8C6UYF9_9GOBI
MNPVLSSVQSLMNTFVGKAQAFVSEIDSVHMVWLEEIQQEANRMFTRDFNAEPELMPKTPSQKRNTRRKRVSLGRQEESQARRRFSKGRRSNLRGSSSDALKSIVEEENASQGSTSKTESTRPKRATRKKQPSGGAEGCRCRRGEAIHRHQVSKNIPSPKVVVAISPEDRLSAELAVKTEIPAGHAATKGEGAQSNKSRRSSVRHSLKLRHSVAGLRRSMTAESIRRASRRSMLKRKAARMGNSTCDSNTEVCYAIYTTHYFLMDIQFKQTCVHETALPPVQAVGRITRSVAANSPKLAPQPLFTVKFGFSVKITAHQTKINFCLHSRLSAKRKAPQSPTKRPSSAKKSQSAIRPNMSSFLHTVHKNQMLMMTPTSYGRSSVLKSFIKHTTPLKMDQKTKERYKLEALRKKQEQEIERIKKMEEEKKKKQEELKSKRDERLRRVFEAKEQKEEEKKKKMEQKMAQNVETTQNDHKMETNIHIKKVMAGKRQEELELKKKQEEEAKMAQEEEARAQKLAEAQRTLELKREQERALERERERRAAAERERLEREKALALQRELERAAREKERRDLEEKMKALEEKRKLEKQLQLAAEEKAAKEREAARKPIPSKTQKIMEWTKTVTTPLTMNLLRENLYHLDCFFGKVEAPNLEKIFYKSKPRYFKRTSSAVWHSPPGGGNNAVYREHHAVFMFKFNVQ